jgi:hypothetical protein
VGSQRLRPRLTAALAGIEEAKPLAVAAQKVLERALAELDKEVKDFKDEDRKLEVKEFRAALSQMLDKIKALAK